MKQVDCIKSIVDLIGPLDTPLEQKQWIESLLIVAASMANAASHQSVGFSEAHVTEAVDEMIATLTETFGLR